MRNCVPWLFDLKPLAKPRTWQGAMTGPDSVAVSPGQNASAGPRPRKRPRPDYRRLKIHRNYTVEEITRVLGVHRNTVREWVRQGLTTVDGDRPMLILGSELIAFEKRRRTRNRRTCAPGEFYCLRCRELRSALDGRARYQALTTTQGNLVATCSRCSASMNRRISLARLAMDRGNLAISLPQAVRHISESDQSSLNSAFRQETQSDANAQCRE